MVRPCPLALRKGEVLLVKQWQTGLSICGMKPRLDINLPLSVGSGGCRAWRGAGVPFLPSPERPAPVPHPGPPWVGQSCKEDSKPWFSPQAPHSITSLHSHSGLGRCSASPLLHYRLENKDYGLQ